MTEQNETLLHGVGTTAFSPKSVGVEIRRDFSDGVQSQQVERLHRSVFHGRDTQRAFLAVAFGDVHTPERLGLVAVLLERV